MHLDPTPPSVFVQSVEFHGNVSWEHHTIDTQRFNIIINLTMMRCLVLLSMVAACNAFQSGWVSPRQVQARPMSDRVSRADASRYHIVSPPLGRR